MEPYLTELLSFYHKILNFLVGSGDPQIVFECLNSLFPYLFFSSPWLLPFPMNTFRWKWKRALAESKAFGTSWMTAIKKLASFSAFHMPNLQLDRCVLRWFNRVSFTDFARNPNHLIDGQVCLPQINQSRLAYLIRSRQIMKTIKRCSLKIAFIWTYLHRLMYGLISLSKIQIQLQTQNRIKAPVVLLIHGGAFLGGSARGFHNYEDIGSKFVAQGILVASLQYRLGWIGLCVWRVNHYF